LGFGTLGWLLLRPRQNVELNGYYELGTALPPAATSEFKYSLPIAKPIVAYIDNTPNGFVFKNRLNNGKGELSVSNGRNENAVLKLIDLSRQESVFSVMIRSGSDYSISGIPDGRYKVLFALGHGWSNELNAFQDSYGYSAFKEDFIFKALLERNGAYQQWSYDKCSITLNPVIGGNAKTEKLNENEFTKYQ
jgi:hypothetical protein